MGQMNDLNDQQWNKELKEHNAKLMIVAERDHRIKQDLKQNLEAAVRVAVDAYPNEDGVRVGMPPETSEHIMEILRVIRALGKAKEKVDLSGQAVDEFKITLPDWAELQ